MKIEEKKQTEIKQAVGQKAASLVKEGMIVGLGTGSTAAFFIESLIEHVKEGLKITAVSSSIRSSEMAKNGGIPVIGMNEVTKIDLTVDGADEIDPLNRLIKGAGGALVREKILASTSEQMVVIADESKLVSHLGKCGLPVEILPFGYKATIDKLVRLGYTGTLRKNPKDTSLYITDNGNYIFDIHSPDSFLHPEEDNARIINIPGVVDTGFFFNLATSVLVGYSDGTVEFRK